MQAARVAVVTGAGGGIGRAIALRLAGDGDTVAVVDLRREAAEETTGAIRAAGGRAAAFEFDLGAPEATGALVDEVAATLGEPAVLVNNAADHGERVDFLEVPLERWRRIIDTNVTSAAFLAQAVAPRMAGRGGGVIVNLLAIQEHLPVPTYVPYVTSKGALSALTRALAVELAPLGIRVCGVTPSMIASPSTATALSGAAGSAGAAAAPPAPTLVGRLGLPEEVAEAVAFLASERAAYVTGAELRVDGGRLISRRPDPLMKA